MNECTGGQGITVTVCPGDPQVVTYPPECRTAFQMERERTGKVNKWCPPSEISGCGLAALVPWIIASLPGAPDPVCSFPARLGGQGGHCTGGYTELGDTALGALQLLRRMPSWFATHHCPGLWWRDAGEFMSLWMSRPWARPRREEGEYGQCAVFWRLGKQGHKFVFVAPQGLIGANIISYTVEKMCADCKTTVYPATRVFPSRPSKRPKDTLSFRCRPSRS